MVKYHLLQSDPLIPQMEVTFSALKRSRTMCENEITTWLKNLVGWIFSYLHVHGPNPSKHFSRCYIFFGANPQKRMDHGCFRSSHNFKECLFKECSPFFSRPNRWVSSRCGESKRKTFPQKGSLGVGEYLLGGFKYVLLSPRLGEMIQFD